jgi:Spy/CpxP family protein refolding chaperone
MAPMQPGHRHGMFPLVRRLNLTAQQRSQIRSIVQQYRASHPKGSPRDPQAFRAMRKQVIGVLTPQQRTQLRSEVRQHRAPGSTVFPSPAASPRPL